jgi:two-component system cell cycle response regulator
MNIADPTTTNGKPILLVVDDDELSRKLLARMLNIAGYETVDAGNGQEALGYLETHSVDAVLMDVLMPGIDGFEVCKRIRLRPATASLPVVLFTALVDLDSAARGAEAGVNQVVQKPANFAKLVNLLGTLLLAGP